MGGGGEVEMGFKFGSREMSLEATAPVQVRDKGSLEEDEGAEASGWV